MDISRRNFLKLSCLSTIAFATGLGFDTKIADATQSEIFQRYSLGDMGNIQDKPDDRDFSTLAIFPHDTKLPSKVSWKDKVPMILDQGGYGICVGAAGTAMKNIQETIQGDCPIHGFSPVYLYTLCKKLDGDKNNKNWGTYSRSAVKVLCSKGILPYVEIPTSYLKDNNRKLPTITNEQIKNATRNKCKSYASVPIAIESLKKSLTHGAILGSLNVYESFWEPEQGGYIRKPEGHFYGGHCICITGFDDKMEYTYENGEKEVGFVEIVNSWSDNWGNNGFAYVPYSSLNKGYGLWYAFWSTIDDTTQIRKLWRVQSGSFTNKEDAQIHQIALKKKKLPTCLEYVDTFDGLEIRVQIRTYTSEKSCNDYSERLLEKGIENFVVYY